jgi:hypothetical protein
MSTTATAYVRKHSGKCSAQRITLERIRQLVLENLGEDISLRHIRRLVSGD